VEQGEVSTVHPEEPCEPHVMAMSGADHIVRPRHIPLLLFYAARQDGSQVIRKKPTTLPTLNPTCQFNLRVDSMNLLSFFFFFFFFYVIHKLCFDSHDLFILSTADQSILAGMSICWSEGMEPALMQCGFTNDMHAFACITFRSVSIWELSLFRTLVSTSLLMPQMN
jgi:hypothetical protein